MAIDVKGIFVWWRHSGRFFGEIKLLGDVRLVQYMYVYEVDLKSDVATLWKTNTLRKKFIFGCRLFHKSLSCQMELSKWNVIEGLQNTACPLCVVGEEDLDHFF